MELVEGENLRQRMKRGGLTRMEALRICRDVACALQCGWQGAQLIHRDIKPSNIYLSQSGDVKLGDLGLAKSLLANTTGVTHAGTAIGTPHYISPEQARGDTNIDLRADIYSLGCTLYELVTGVTPYKGSDALTVMSMHLNSPSPAILKVLPQCPIPLGRLVSRMMRKNRRERHQTYEELIAAMEQVMRPSEPGAELGGASVMVTAWRQIGAAEQHGAFVRPAAAAHATPAPSRAKGKSRRGLWLGLAAGLLGMAGGALFLARPKSAAAPAAPSRAAAAPTLAAVSAGPPGGLAAEPWQDLLAAPEKIHLYKAEQLTPRGVVLPHFASVGVSNRFTDGAIRMRATFGRARPGLEV
jgi:hypothetical protein